MFIFFIAFLISCTIDGADKPPHLQNRKMTKPDVKTAMQKVCTNGDLSTLSEEQLQDARKTLKQQKRQQYFKWVKKHDTQIWCGLCSAGLAPLATGACSAVCLGFPAESGVAACAPVALGFLGLFAYCCRPDQTVIKERIIKLEREQERRKVKTE